MKLKRYYAGLLTTYYASIPVGDKAVFVTKLVEQPPEGWELREVFEDYATFIDPQKHDNLRREGWFSSKLQYPEGTIIGIPEVWGWDLDEGCVYLIDDLPENTPHGKEFYNPAITIKNDDIRILYKVTGKRVCSVNDILSRLLMKESKENFKDWFTKRYPGDWEKNVYCEITQTERIERP